MASAKKKKPANAPPVKCEQAVLETSSPPHSAAASDIMVHTIANSLRVEDANLAQRFSRRLSASLMSTTACAVQSQVKLKGSPTVLVQQPPKAVHSRRINPAPSAAPDRAASPSAMVRPQRAVSDIVGLVEQCCTASLALAAAMASSRAVELESCAHLALMRSFSCGVSAAISEGSRALRHPLLAAFQVFTPDAAIKPAAPSTSPTQAE
mmetsp:Transcript_7956/g.18291  ORF Transcript_7956/g.18291 Transcript_7956/m.18291 type:complete len:209 (-) Transcript_7956:206-832(-)